MRRSNCKTAALIAASIAATATPVLAINAIFIPGPSAFESFTNSSVEVQGFNGRFDLPTTIQGPTTSNFFGDSISGAAANDSILYTLLNPFGTSGNSVITESDTHTGAYLGTLQLSARLTDIAYTNGQLYGAQSVGAFGQKQSLQISSIASNGTITPILTQTTNFISSTNWILSGVVSGDSLLISPPNDITSTNPAQIFIPSTPSTPPTTFNLPSGTIPLTTTILHADGAGVTISDVAGRQTDYSYPGGTLIGSRSLTTLYGSPHLNKPPSDEFSYTYSSSQPADVTLSISTSTGTNVLGQDGLFRLPQTVTTPTYNISLFNGTAPDGTTLNNVVANGLVQQVSGAPIPITIQETDSPAGTFTNRQIAQASATFNLANVPRGVYEIGTNSNITADYTTGSSTQTGRPVSATSNSSAAYFAYDPVSANLVGDGDGSLNGLGWEMTDSQSGTVLHGFDTGSNLGLGLSAEAGDPESLTQFLQLPTANGPMELSFTYENVGFDPGNLTVSLNGVVLGNLSVTSTTPSTFQTIINNPSLENLTDANLTFQDTDAGSDEPAWVGLGSVTLEAVPEPTSTTTLAIAGLTLTLRRRLRRPN